VASKKCRNQRQRNYDPVSHIQTPQRHVSRPDAKMLPRHYHDKDVLGAVKPK
jgi:hypothetical protein